MQLANLNKLDDAVAASVLLRCCGSARWASAMVAARPFADAEALTTAADNIWRNLDAVDWLEAFAAHPKIGSSGSGRSDSSEWSRQEQAAARTASTEIQERMVAANRAYEARFGYIFIICATGRRGDEMLAECERRLSNTPDAEFAVAGEEQRKITRLRLVKLLES
jgi:2-oxo-4-hydroxy-4-carboxy-5-ureidoimidazoline decarboxylase